MPNSTELQNLRLSTFVLNRFSLFSKPIFSTPVKLSPKRIMKAPLIISSNALLPCSRTPIAAAAAPRAVKTVVNPVTNPSELTISRVLPEGTASPEAAVSEQQPRKPRCPERQRRNQPASLQVKQVNRQHGQYARRYECQYAFRECKQILHRTTTF